MTTEQTSDIVAQPAKRNGKKRASAPVAPIDDAPASFVNGIVYPVTVTPPVWDGRGSLQGKISGLEEWNGTRFFVFTVTAGTRYGTGKDVFVALELELRPLLELAIDPQRIAEVWLKKRDEGGYHIVLNREPTPRASA